MIASSARFGAALLALLVVGAIAPGCKEDDPDYPPFEDDGCVGLSCGAGVNTGGSGKAGSSSTGGTGGGGGESGAAGQDGTSGAAGTTGGDAGAAGSPDDGTTATVTGEVVVLADSLFLTGSAYPGTATVVVDQASPSTSASWDGVTPLELPGVPGGSRLFATTPVNATADLLGTLVRYQVTPPSLAASFPLVDAQVLRTTVAALPTPQTLTPGTAHALVTVTDAAGQPVQGVTAAVSGAGAVAYDLADDYSGTKTGSRGTILIVNIIGAGQVSLVLTDTQGLQASTVLPIQPDVMTFAGVQL